MAGEDGVDKRMERKEGVDGRLDGWINESGRQGVEEDRKK